MVAAPTWERTVIYLAGQQVNRGDPEGLPEDAQVVDVQGRLAVDLAIRRGLAPPGGEHDLGLFNAALGEFATQAVRRPLAELTDSGAVVIGTHAIHVPIMYQI